MTELAGKALLLFVAMAVLPALAMQADGGEKQGTVKTSEIRIRDPFVLPVPEEGRYYLYGTMGPKDPSRGPVFQAYFSRDLEEWSGPIVVFRPPAGFWATRDFWAPEVHRYKGRYYLFASFKADGACRGTQILTADRPRGPFRPISDGPMTPRDWECLDGTLFVDDEGSLWMVFCHEWLQVHDGEMCAIRLSPDLDKPIGEPVLLFRASDAPWATTISDKKDFVTDGPFLYRTTSGELLMLWSSFGKSGYAVGVARSTSGKITGPWKQDPEPIFSADGGHAMIFRTFEGRLMMSLHQPNSQSERARFVPVREVGGRLVVE